MSDFDDIDPEDLLDKLSERMRQEDLENDNETCVNPEELIENLLNDDYSYDYEKRIQQEEQEYAISQATYTRKTILGKDHMQCEACQEYFECAYSDTTTPHLDGGSTMQLSTGDYAGFNDMNAGGLSVVLCHDCSMRIYRMIPKFRGLTGLHPVGCCNGAEYQQGKPFQDRVKEKYTRIFNDLFGPFSDSDSETEWPIFDGQGGGCEWSWHH